MSRWSGISVCLSLMSVALVMVAVSAPHVYPGLAAEIAKPILCYCAGAVMASSVAILLRGY